MAPPAAADTKPSTVQQLTLAQDAFRSFVSNPTGRFSFDKFLQKEGRQANLHFYLDVEKFHASSKFIVDTKMAGKIYTAYIHDGATEQIDIAPADRNAIIDHLKRPRRDMFDSAQSAIFDLLFTDSYRRFIHILLQRKAQATLQTNTQEPGAFVGLGDCFCFTDPNLPDNPIVAASDGFINVTGYSREDIIPHNCRFLQGEGTDKEANRRVGQNIRNDQEVTELLLNYKKDGTPFWNLLYICPLRDQTGKTMFFLGGQVDVTKNINNNSPLGDLLDILGVPRKEKKGSIFSRIFRRKAKKQATGAEESTVDPTLDYETQKDVFLETYTNFIIFDVKETFGAIRFVSKKFTEITGFAEKDVLGKDASFFQGPLTSSQAISEMKSAMKLGQSWSKEIVSYDAEGNPHMNHVFLTPVKDGENKPRFYSVVMKWRQPKEGELDEIQKSGNVEKTDCFVS